MVCLGGDAWLGSRSDDAACCLIYRYPAMASGIDPDAEFLACVEREKPTRTTARCANTLFEHYVSEPSHPLKPAKLRFAASFQKTLLAYDKGADAEQTKADINLITAQFLQDVQAAGNAAIQSQRAADARNAAGLRAIAEAVKAAGQPQHMMSSEEYRERITTRPSTLNGNTLYCQNIDKNTFACR